MTDETRIEVLTVAPGSIIHFHNVVMEEGALDKACEAIAKVVGHQDWCLVCTESGGDVEVWPADELTERVAAHFRRTEA